MLRLQWTNLLRKEIKNKEKIYIIYNSLIKDITNVSSDFFGTFVVQELIKKIDDNNIEEIFKLLVSNSQLEELASNKNSNHVLQSLIKIRKIKENDIISEKICDGFDRLSINKYGCYVIKTLLKHCNEKYYKLIYEKTCDNFDKLIQDEFGNHIISFFLDNKKGKNNDIFYQKLKGKVFDFSSGKYAAFTMNKLIKKGNKKQRKNIIDEIFNSDKTINGEDCLIYLSKHNFGNYVV